MKFGFVAIVVTGICSFLYFLHRKKKVTEYQKRTQEKMAAEKQTNRKVNPTECESSDNSVMHDNQWNSTVANKIQANECDLLVTSSKPKSLNSNEQLAEELCLSDSKEIVIQMDTRKEIEIDMNASDDKAVDMNVSDNKAVNMNASDSEIVTNAPNDDEIYLTTPNDNEVNLTISKDNEINSTTPNDSKVNSSEPDASEINSTEPDASEIYSTEPDASEINSTEPDASEINSTELNVNEINSTEPNVNEINSTEPNPSEVSMNVLNCAVLNGGDTLESDVMRKDLMQVVINNSESSLKENMPHKCAGENTDTIGSHTEPPQSINIFSTTRPDEAVSKHGVNILGNSRNKQSRRRQKKFHQSLNVEQTNRNNNAKMELPKCERKPALHNDGTCTSDLEREASPEQDNCIDDQSLGSQASVDSGQGSIPEAEHECLCTNYASDALEPYTVFKFDVPQHLVGKLVGLKGNFFRKLKSSTGAYISIGGVMEDRVRPCSIEGPQSEVNKCLEMIRAVFPIWQYPDLAMDKVEYSFLPPPSEQPYELFERNELVLPHGTIFQVRLSKVKNPSEVWVQQPGDSSYHWLDKLHTFLNVTYGSDGNNSPVVNLPVRPLMVCVFKVDTQWLRCQVLESDGTYAIISFVDIGGTSRVLASSLRQILNDYMKLPFQATQCFLYGIKSPERGWAYEDSSALWEMVDHKLIFASVAAVTTDGTAFINLYHHDQHEYINLNKRLIDVGHALSVIDEIKML